MGVDYLLTPIQLNVQLQPYFVCFIVGSPTELFIGQVGTPTLNRFALGLLQFCPLLEKGFEGLYASQSVSCSKLTFKPSKKVCWRQMKHPR
jgi:hypothetical protein